MRALRGSKVLPLVRLEQRPMKTPSGCVHGRTCKSSTGARRQ